jgi:hypothetical protein
MEHYGDKLKGYTEPILNRNPYLFENTPHKCMLLIPNDVYKYIIKNKRRNIMNILDDFSDKLKTAIINKQVYFWSITNGKYMLMDKVIRIEHADNYVYIVTEDKSRKFNIYDISNIESV